MVHWPDNMDSYLAEDKVLFSNDAFGQHFASPERFDDELPLHLVVEADPATVVVKVIDDGPGSKVKKIEFEGNRVMSGGKLRGGCRA